MAAALAMWEAPNPAVIRELLFDCAELLAPFWTNWGAPLYYCCLSSVRTTRELDCDPASTTLLWGTAESPLPPSPAEPCSAFAGLVKGSTTVVHLLLERKRFSFYRADISTFYIQENRPS